MSRKVVIAGLGFVCSIGNSRTDVTDSLIQLRHGLAPASFFADVDAPVRLAGIIRGFAVDSPNALAWKFPAQYSLPQERLRGFPPHGLYALCAAEQAIADAALAPEDLKSGETGLCGASVGSPRMLFHHHREAESGGAKRWHPLAVVSSAAGSLNFNIAAWYGIRGVNCGFISACASSSHAIGYACDEVMLGRQKRVLVVAGEDCNAENLLPFIGMRALSREEDPEKASRPFDRNRDGFVGSGGGVCLILEEAESVRSRGATPYAEILGWGQAADGFSTMAPHPEGIGLADAMRRAIQQARASPVDIGYVNAHATSTPAGDLSEGKALLDVFSRHNLHPWVSSTKALTGHPLSMAGALETAICALAQREGFIPGAAHLVEKDPAFDHLRFPEETLRRAPGLTLTNSSGFGGSNVSILLGPPPE